MKIAVFYRLEQTKDMRAAGEEIFLILKEFLACLIACLLAAGLSLSAAFLARRRRRKFLDP